MTILLPALAVASAAFCVWLIVRIVNRRERWAKRTLAAIAAVALYPLSMGPLVWLESRELLPQWSIRPLEMCFTPLMFVASESESAEEAFGWYTDLWPPRRKRPMSADEIQRELRELDGD